VLFIEWDDEELSVSIELIDCQHKKLIEIINKLSAEIESQQQPQLINDLFIELQEYTQYHFETEERYFSSLNVKQTKLHKLQYKHFIEQLEALNASENGTEQLSKELFSFLMDWFVSHIQDSDRHFIQNQPAI
jgi:hemerythrin-like metal-binding protein